MGTQRYVSPDAWHPAGEIRSSFMLARVHSEPDGRTVGFPMMVASHEARALLIGPMGTHAFASPFRAGRSWTPNQVGVRRGEPLFPSCRSSTRHPSSLDTGLDRCVLSPEFAVRPGVVL
jgi:hypothetical protein